MRGRRGNCNVRRVVKRRGRERWGEEGWSLVQEVQGDSSDISVSCASVRLVDTLNTTQINISVIIYFACPCPIHWEYDDIMKSHEWNCQMGFFLPMQFLIWLQPSLFNYHPAPQTTAELFPALWLSHRPSYDARCHHPPPLQGGLRNLPYQWWGVVLRWSVCNPRDPDATLDGAKKSPVGHPLPQGDPCGLGQVQMFK